MSRAQAWQRVGRRLVQSHAHIGRPPEGSQVWIGQALIEAADLSDALFLLAERWVEVHPNPCRIDHHGDCQEHYVSPAAECPVAMAAAIVMDDR